MYTQNTDRQYEVITVDQSLQYDLKNMKDYEYSEYNGSTALVIDEAKVLIFPNITEGSALITSKEVCDEMFAKNSFPVLPENDTPYFRYKSWMNKEEFNKKNMSTILGELGLTYNVVTFYDDAEKLAKTLSEDDRKKLLIVMLYFIGEDLRKLCPETEWSFSRRYYFQPFDEPILIYDDHFYSFFDLNVLLDQKLVEGKKITFKNTYKKVEGYYLKKKWFWEKH